MSVDSVILDGKIRLTLSAPFTIDRPEQLRKMIDSSPGISPTTLYSIFELLPFRDDSQRAMYGVAPDNNQWGSFQSIRKKHGSDQYLRQNMSITFLIDSKSSARISITPVNATPEFRERLEKIRNVLGLWDLLNELNLENRKTQPNRAMQQEGKGRRHHNNSRAQHAGETFRPFEDLRNIDWQGRNSRANDRRRDKERFDRQEDHD